MNSNAHFEYVRHKYLIKLIAWLICVGYHMRGEVISVLSLERRYRILSRVNAANEGQNMIS